MSVDHFKLAYKEFSECANDLIVDIPELWLYILQFAGKFSYIYLYLYI